MDAQDNTQQSTSELSMNNMGSTQMDSSNNNETSSVNPSQHEMQE